ncbi:bifunctional 3'-5' exonuclease/ATP-dependent helicase WRN isoform X2 [Engraulis encrasicolus]|uniref:bifunctional 3'-5' exonuclease/ATP-dependent helicase WRN isoform X2 n=1 Tax=Engraulis encrasicolus TaxID=184585 RepID=UPI002FD4CB25
MSDRALPEWMSSVQNSHKESNKQSGPLKKNVLEPDLPYLEFAGTIIYSHEKNDCSFLSEDLRLSLPPGSAVGFDLEWPPSFTKGKTKKVAMVQMCASQDKCYLFHVSSMTGFPSGLKMLLEDETIKKVGVGIDGDKWKLMADFDIKLKNCVELSDLANEKLRCVEKWSLDGLVKHLFMKKLFKDNGVRCSQWDEFELTEAQKRYAAIDAYAGLIIHQQLEAIAHGRSVHGNLKNKLSQLLKDFTDLSDSVSEEVSCTSRAEELLEEISQRLQSLKDEVLPNNTTTTTSSEESQPDPESKQHPPLQPPVSLNTHGATHTITPPTIKPDPDESPPPLEGHSGWTDRVPKKEPEHCEPYSEVPFKEPKPRGEQRKMEDGRSADTARQCMMSLDISEYELQMIEMQARQEELDEQSRMDFNSAALLDSSDLSCEVLSDEELENEMLQCVEEVEKQSERPKTPHKASHDQKPPQKSEEDLVIEEDDDDIEEEEEEEGFDPSLPEPTAVQIKCLKTYFGHHSFKPVQWKVIHSVLRERKDNLVVMATGYGKSLCFQFPPVLCGNISVVISPLIALMEDQVLHLKMSNIPACFLGSAQTKNVSAELKKGLFRVVYMTPEFCSSNMTLLEHLNSTVGLSLIAIDEAHCISQWGHDFRNAYRDLGKLKRSLPKVPIVALTATASPSIREDIVKSLHLKDPVVTCTTFDRPNLYLDVNRKSSDIYTDFKRFLNKKQGGGYEFEGPVIVYCLAKKEAERVADSLSRLEVRCGVYHAGLKIQERRETHHSFMRDEIQCVVATVAFGMGINKPDIRKVIHYGAPKEMESYYQEIGRAGRDGLPASCHVLWTPQDMALNRFLLNQTNSDKMRIFKMQMMAKMEKYLNSNRCRRKLILSHFEDKQLRKVTSGILGTSKCCDNCKFSSSRAVLSPSKGEPHQSLLQDFGDGTFQLLGAIDSLNERFGITVPIMFLRGSTAQKVPEKYRRLPLYGAGKSIPDTWWKALGRVLVIEGYLAEASGVSKFTTLCKMTPKGRTWYSKAKDASQRTLLLPPNRDLFVRTSAPRQNETANSRNQGLSAAQSPQPPGTFSRFESNRSGRNLDSPRSGCPPHHLPPSPRASSSSSGPAAKSQPPPVSARELELQAELYGKLVSERQKLASTRDIPPAILATNKILLDMAKTRPCTVASLKQVDGVSEAKATMLEPLLQTILQFCKTHGLKINVPSSSTPPPPSSGPVQACPSSSAVRSNVPVALPDGVNTTYRLFQLEAKTLRQVCDVRSLPQPVVEGHLVQALVANHPLDVERAGLTPHIRSTVTRIVTAPPFNSDVSDMRAVRARVPEEISTFHLRLAVTLLQKDAVSQATATANAGQVSSHTSHDQLAWIEPEAKPNQVPKKQTTLRTVPLQPPRVAPQPPPPPPAAPAPISALTAAAPRPPQVSSSAPPDFLDEMDVSEDDLFSEMPMPEEEDMGCSTSTHPTTYGSSRPRDAAPVVPQSSGMDMASWNQEELDKDTQDLFSDSPPPQQQSASHPGKRKLPEWAGASSRAPLPSASSKNTKRKKGLFM